MVPLPPRLKADKLRAMLRNEYYLGWRDHHRDISDYIQPRRARFLTSDAKTAGTKKNEKIINNVATDASDTLRAGLMSGITSPARPWFKLTTHDPNLNEDPEVKDWLHEAERITQAVIAKSNFYLRIEELYGDLGDFGTAVFHVEQDDAEYIRCYVYPVGSYFVASSERLEIDTVFRDVPMTVTQLVKKFKYENCCLQVRLAWDRGEIFAWYDVVHFIMPNEEFVPGAIGQKGKKFVSVWYEVARTIEEGFLHESGYDYFPVMVPRWKVTGTDSYGSSPGMNALADVKALQHLEEQAMGLVDKTVNPPMNVPALARAQQASLLPGAENPVAMSGQKLEPALLIDPRAMQYVQAKIQEHVLRIKQAYHADLFRMLEAYESGKMTAYEVQQRVQEKMQLLGPAYERLEEELLDPALDAILKICFEQFLYPEVPQALIGQEIKVEYTSIIAQAQKATGTGVIRELLGLIGNLYAVDQDIVDVIDFDRAILEYATMLGISPKILRSPEAVAAIRDAKAKVAQQQQQMQQAAQLAQGAKVLSETDTGQKNALTDMLQPTGRV